MNFLNVIVQKDGDGFLLDGGSFKLAAPGSRGDLLRSYAGKTAIFGVRPADLFDKSLIGATEGQPGNTIRTQVDVVEPMGDVTSVYLTSGPHQIVATLDGETKAREGETLDIVADLERTHLFDAETQNAVY
jgi:multiple sugar transport system ATP-binding protein